MWVIRTSQYSGRGIRSRLRRKGGKDGDGESLDEKPGQRKGPLARNAAIENDKKGAIAQERLMPTALTYVQGEDIHAG